jgi:PAB1-binding protein PBP1
MKRLFLLLAALGAAAALFSMTAGAQQYKWVDKDGRVRYGDVPPPGVKATPLKPPPRISSPAPSSPAGKKDEKAKPLTPEQAFQQRRQEQQEQDQKAAKEQAAAEQKRANCAQAQSNLRGIQAGARIATTNAAGERVFLDDAEIAKERERAQRAVNEWCN